MEEYARQLVKKLRGDAPPEENPLEMIRFSPDILQLGLSNDDLYDFCRRSARALLAKFHPDRLVGSGGEASEIALRYSKAFELLEDRQVFERALAEFRIARSYVRAEERTLRAQIQNFRDQTRDLGRSLDEAQQTIAAANKYRDWMRTYLFQHSLRIKPSSGAVTLAECASISAVQFHFTFASGPPQLQMLPEIKKQYQEAVNKSARGRKNLLLEEESANLEALVNQFRVTCIEVSDLITRARRSEDTDPKIQWGYGLALRELGMDKLVGITKSEHGGVIQSQEVFNPIERIRYRSALNTLSDLFREDYVSGALIAPQKLSVKHQAITGTDGRCLRIIGSVDLTTGISISRRAPAHEYRTQEKLLLNTAPFIVPGCGLVTMETTDQVVWSRNKDGLIGLRTLDKEDLNIHLSHVVISAA